MRGTDYAFRQRLSPTAKRAAAIVGNIRHHEAETVWTKEVEDDEGDVYPGMMFTLAKDRMEGTKLWKIAKRMPKGCLLHAHLEAMVESECSASCLDLKNDPPPLWVAKKVVGGGGGSLQQRPLLTLVGNSGLVVKSRFGNPRNPHAFGYPARYPGSPAGCEYPIRIHHRDHS